MSKRQWAEEMLEDINPEALFMDGFDEAIVGVSVGQAGQESVVVYDEGQIIDIIMSDGTSDEDAWDHYGFNIQGAYVGTSTPIIIKRVPEDL